MSELPKLLLCPLLSSYSPTTPSGVLTTQAIKGMPRQRKAIENPTHSTPVSFIVRGSAAVYLKAFWRQHRASAFQMRLILDDEELSWYECRFTGDQQQQRLGGRLVQWSNSITVKSKAISPETDQTIIYMYEQSDGDTNAYLNLLDVLVNQELPDALENL